MPDRTLFRARSPQARPPARVTLRQIGQQLGLSTFAVSRALAGKDGVSDETRQRVAAMAERLAYRRPEPSRAARDIALVFHQVDAVNGELSLQIERGVQREAQRRNCSVRFQSTQSPAQVGNLMKECLGLLMVGLWDAPVVETLRSMHKPIVRLGWIDPLEPVDQVIGADREAGQAVAHHLLDLGHRSIAFVFGSPDYRGRWERFYGAREALERQAGVPLHPIQFEERQGGFLDAMQDLERRAVRPTAFFCAHDGLALTVISELLRLRLRIPDDASVVGFGDFSPATQIAPQLTTVRVDGAGMGAAALRLMLERIESVGHDDRGVQRILIPSQIVARASTGPVRSSQAGGKRFSSA